MRTLILGLGNPILCDDAVGLIVARQVYESVRDKVREVELVEASVAGLNILDIVQGYDKVVVVDSIQTKDGTVGDLYEVGLDDIRVTPRLKSPHGIDFALAIEMGKAFGVQMPAVVRIYAVEVEDPFTFSEEPTPRVQAAIPRIVAAIASAEFGDDGARVVDN